jgi:hypothetical protein
MDNEMQSGRTMIGIVSIIIGVTLAILVHTADFHAKKADELQCEHALCPDVP